MRRQEFLLKNGHRIAASVAGREDAPPVVLMHGGGQTRHAWGKAAEALARAGYRACSIDMRGHGESDWAADRDYSIDSYCADLREILAGLGRPAVLVGASLGGITALITAGEVPDMGVPCMVLVDITSRADVQGMDKIRNFMESTIGGFDSIESAADAVAEYLPHRRRPSDLSGLRKNLRRKEDGRFYWHWDPHMRLANRAFSREEMDLRMEAAALRVNVPTLILRGGRSELVTSERANAFSALFAKGEVAEILDAHHMVAGDQNDPFNQALVSFIVKHAGLARRVQPG